MDFSLLSQVRGGVTSVDGILRTCFSDLAGHVVSGEREKTGVSTEIYLFI